MYQTTPDTISDEAISQFKQRGFIKIPGVISRKKPLTFTMRRWRPTRVDQGRDRPVFSQHVNVWREDETMRALTLHKNVGGVAQRLAGVPMRLWHDHILIKQPNNQVATEFFTKTSPTGHTPIRPTRYRRGLPCATFPLNAAV